MTMTWLLTEEEIRTAASLAANMPEDWARLQLKKVAEELPKAMAAQVGITVAEISLAIDQLGYWNELKKEAGL